MPSSFTDYIPKLKLYAFSCLIWYGSESVATTRFLSSSVCWPMRKPCPPIAKNTLIHSWLLDAPSISRILHYMPRLVRLQIRVQYYYKIVYFDYSCFTKFSNIIFMQNVCSLSLSEMNILMIEFVWVQCPVALISIRSHWSAGDFRNHGLMSWHRNFIFICSPNS